MSYAGQIMFKYKYPNIFSLQIYYPSNFFATHAVLKIGGHSQISPSFSWGIFGHVMCLEQSHASEKN